jgi:hypothetical protein
LLYIGFEMTTSILALSCPKNWISRIKDGLEKRSIDWEELSDKDYFTESWLIPEGDKSVDEFELNFFIDLYVRKTPTNYTPHFTPVNVSNKLKDKFYDAVFNKDVSISFDGKIQTLSEMIAILSVHNVNLTEELISSSNVITNIPPEHNCSWEKKGEKIPASHYEIVFNNTVDIVELTAILHLIVYDKGCKKISFFFEENRVCFKIYYDSLDEEMIRSNIIHVFTENYVKDDFNDIDSDSDTGTDDGFEDIVFDSSLELPDYELKLVVPWKPMVVQYETISRASKPNGYPSIEEGIADKYSLFKTAEYQTEIQKWNWNDVEANKRNIPKWVHEEKSFCVFSISNQNNLNYRYDSKVYFVMINIRPPKGVNQPLSTEIPKIISVYKKYQRIFQAVEIVINDSSFKLEVRFFIKVEKPERMKMNMKEVIDIIEEFNITYDKSVPKPTNNPRMNEDTWKKTNARVAPKICDPRRSSDDWISDQLSGRLLTMKSEYRR